MRISPSAWATFGATRLPAIRLAPRPMLAARRVMDVRMVFIPRTSEGGIALDCGTEQLAPQMSRAAGSQVDQRAVVPEDQVVWLPLMAVDVLIEHAQGIQLLQDIAALVFRKT